MNKHDSPRIGLINKHEAIIYYKDGTTINLHSDDNVLNMISIMCTPSKCNNFETYVHSLDDTQSIKVGV